LFSLQSKELEGFYLFYAEVCTEEKSHSTFSQLGYSEIHKSIYSEHNEILVLDLPNRGMTKGLFPIVTIARDSHLSIPQMS